MERLDFHYEISDERLLAYSCMPVLDRLKWLDDVRRFTLMMRAAPDIPHAPDETASPIADDKMQSAR